MSELEIKCSFCQASFNEAEGICPYCGRTVSQIKKEKEVQSKILSSLQEQIDACRPEHEAEKTLKEEVLPIMERIEAMGTRIENKQNTHRQENKAAFQKLEAKLDEHQKALLDGMKEILAHEEGIDASVKAYFDKAISLREKAGPDASEKIGEKTIYASPVKHLEQMKEGEAAPFPEFFNCVGFELRNQMETTLKRLGIPVIRNTGEIKKQASSGDLQRMLEEDKAKANEGSFQFPMISLSGCPISEAQKQAYWNIRQNIIDLAEGKIRGKSLQKGLAGYPADRFLCVLGDEKTAKGLAKIWDSCNAYIHGSSLPSDQLSGEIVESNRKKFLDSINAINESGLLADKKI